MNHYFRIEAATATNVINAYCGTDDKNTLPDGIPSEPETGTFQLPADMDQDDALHTLVGKMFAHLAVANIGNRIVVRMDSSNLLTYWISPILL